MQHQQPENNSNNLNISATNPAEDDESYIKTAAQNYGEVSFFLYDPTTVR